MKKSAVLGVMISSLMIMAVGLHSVGHLEMSNDPQASAPAPAPAMYMLGDSTVDCGDNTLFIHPTNLSRFPCNGSDSLLLPHLLAKKMGSPDPTPFYSLNTSIHGLMHSINFGSPQASILYTNAQSYQSLNQQLRQVFETMQLLQLQLGPELANQFIKSSIFYLSFGKDDFVNFFLSNSSMEGFSQILVNQMVNAVRDLYASNVRKIVCSGVLPLGCTPRMMLEFGSLSDKDCIDGVNRVVLEYNARLEQNIVAMNVEFHDAHIVFCDIYRALIKFIANPWAYGIEDVVSACCGQGRYNAESGCQSLDMACPKASSLVWWELDNPTPTINAMVADSAWSGQPLSFISRPITVHELFSIPV